MRRSGRFLAPFALGFAFAATACGGSQKEAASDSTAAVEADPGTTGEGKEETPPPDPAAEREAALLAAEMKAYEQARPVFEAHCVRCHTANGSAANEVKQKAREHVAMDQYPFGGHHVGDLGAEVREVVGGAGKAPTMPLDDPGSVKDQELKDLLAWADAYEQAEKARVGYHARSAGHDDDGDHDDD